MMKPFLKRGAIYAVLALLLTMWGVAPAHAQVAKIVAIQSKTEKRSGTGPWAAAPIGTELRTGDRIRTGKRSKVDLKFSDGSLIRLGQLSQLEIRGPREAEISEGRLLFSFLKPGRILAGSGAAEIKGTVGVIEVDEDGNATFALYSGLMDVTTKLRTMSIRPGRFVAVATGGVISRAGNAAPLEYSDGTRSPELLNEPQTGPFIGSSRQLQLRQSEQQRALDPIVDRVTNQVVTGNQNNGDGGEPDGPSPFPVPFPTPDSNPVPDPFPTIVPNPVPTTSPTFTAGAFRIAAAQSAPRLAMAQADPRATNPVATGTVPTAENHLGDADWGTGATVGSDVRILSAFADEGSYIVGGRLHGYAAKGNWFLDAAVVPLRSRQNVNGRAVYNNQTDITDLSATYTTKDLRVQIGRQRYLEGPTTATLFGSMIRTGGREIMDSIRVSPQLSKNEKLEISYVYDSFVRNLPYNVSGPQKAWLGRYERREGFGNFGINALKYQDTTVNDSIGYSADFGVPIIRNQLEFYGELGRDPFRRRLTTFGAYFPGLYQKTGLDVYLEWARLKNSSVAGGAPDELAARVYKRINKNCDALLTVSRFDSGQRTFILGISIGDEVGR